MGVDAFGVGSKGRHRRLEPLGWGRLTGKIRRGQPLPEISRLQSQAIIEAGPPMTDEYVYRVVDALDEVARETGKNRAANRDQLAASTADRRYRHHRRAQRRAIASKLGGCGLESLPHPRSPNWTLQVVQRRSTPIGTSGTLRSATRRRSGGSWRLAVVSFSGCVSGQFVVGSYKGSMEA